MILYNTKRNFLPVGQVDNMKIMDYIHRYNAKTRSGFQDRVQLHFTGPDGSDFIQNYNASLLPGSHFGQFLRKLFGENENYDAFDLDRLIGVYCKLTIVHRTDADGNVYANIADVERSSAPVIRNIFDDDEDIEDIEDEKKDDAEDVISE